MLYDQKGRVVRNMQGIAENQIVIKREDLVNGLYYFQLIIEDQIIGTGKIAIH